jgi:hypothetical protein
MQAGPSRPTDTTEGAAASSCGMEMAWTSRMSQGASPTLEMPDG